MVKARGIPSNILKGVSELFCKVLFDNILGKTRNVPVESIASHSLPTTHPNVEEQTEDTSPRMEDRNSILQGMLFSLPENSCTFTSV